jgi:DNA-binding MarR family transcriptional regulator
VSITTDYTATRSALAATFDEFGLFSPLAVRIVLAISEAGTRSASIRQLADELGHLEPAVRRAANTLCAHGLARRETRGFIELPDASYAVVETFQVARS